MYYFLQISSALCYLHERNYIHEELKPKNIAVIYSTNSSDLPILKLITTSLKYCNNNNSSQIITLATSDNSSVAASSFDCFVPIELYSFPTGLSYTVDIWEFGILSYLFITHTFPYNSLDELYKAINNNPSDYLPKINSYRIDLNDLIENCISPIPDKRPNINTIYHTLANIKADPCIIIIIIIIL